MKPLTERRQSADEHTRSPGSPQHFQSESVVVVLGVMYPSVLPQPVEASTHLDLVPLPPGLVTSQQSVVVVFYDPLSSSRYGEEVPQAAKYRRDSKGDGHVNRTEAQKAVARDLALLSIEKRRESPPLDCHHFRIPEPRELHVPAEGIKEGFITPMSFENFDWKGIKPGDEIEVLDDGLVIARGVIEDLASDQRLIRLKLSYGRGGRTYRREDGWQVRTIRREDGWQVRTIRRES